MNINLSSRILRTLTLLHGWVGLVAGMALFVAFYAGAITVFHHELPHWQGTHPEHPTLEQAQHLLDAVLERHPAARLHVGMTFPGMETPQPLVYWMDEQGIWQYAWNGQIAGCEHPPHSALATLVNDLHASLGLPVAGRYLMGVVSLLYGVALLSGLIIHLPRLNKDLFALRKGNNLKLFWRDAHNLIGIFSLPFHVLFAITGAWLCLFAWQVSVLDPLLFEGRLNDALPAAMDTAPVYPPAQQSAPSGSLAFWSQRAVDTAAEQGMVSFEPVYLKLANAGDAHAIVEVTGKVSRALAPLGAIAINAATGEVLASQLPGQRDANHATLAGIYALHFGEYGNAVVPGLYFLLGMAGSVLFYSGNLLWIESRRKRRQLQQGRAQIIMGNLTIGVCIGVCAAISAAFVGAQILEAHWPLQVETGVRLTCFLVWGGSLFWCLRRSPAQAARELLWLSALLTALIPLAHGVFSGRWLWQSALGGHWALFWIDAAALAMAAGFAALARASTHRAQYGDPKSLWAN